MKFKAFFPPSVSVPSRSSDWMLRWAGESIPAACLLSLAPRQHDRGALRGAGRLGPGLGGRRPVHGQRQRRRLGWGVPAAAPPLHWPRPPAGRALHGHCGHDEASSAEPGGRALLHAALVFLRSAADRQAALGSAQHLQGLCGAGHPQPAAAARARVHARTQSGGLQASVGGGSSLAATGAHASGGLTLPKLATCRRQYCKGGKEDWEIKKKPDFSLFLHSSLLIFCWEGLCMRRRWRPEGAKWTNWENSYFFGFTHWNFDLFRRLFNCSRGSQANLATPSFDVSVCQYPLKFCFPTKLASSRLI